MIVSVTNLNECSAFTGPGLLVAFPASEWVRVNVHRAFSGCERREHETVGRATWRGVQLHALRPQQAAQTVTLETVTRILRQYRDVPK
eukprot:275784-Rhodomonas_salina.2